jgi:hydroxymethylpyrimidine pyrophosphatase-like HAD family hydrolase
LLQAVAARLADEGLEANLVWSIDETRDQGLLDLLPERADKLQAIRFLMQETGHDPDSTVFAGDSGNDIAVLASEIPAVLVANATDSVRAQARAQAERAGQAPRLYLARGGLHGMNGHYAAGALEGLAHFHPQSADWMPLD